MYICIYMNNFLLYGFLFVTALLSTIWINYAKKKEKKGKQYLILFWGKNCYHIHHWITTLVIIATLLISRYATSTVLYGIIAMLLGVMMEDLVYPLRSIFKIKSDCSNLS